MTNQSRISYYVSVKVDNTFLNDGYSQEYPTKLFDVLEGYQVQKMALYCPQGSGTIRQ